MLRENGLEVDEINYAKGGVDEGTVLAIVKAAGSVGAVINTRHATAKAEGWVDKPPSAKTFASAVTADPNLLRRPILVRGSTVLVGYDKTNKEAWAKVRP